MDFFEQIKDFLGSNMIRTKDIHFTFGALIALIAAFIGTTFFLRYLRKFITKKIPQGSKSRFISLFQFLQYLIYILVIFFTLDISGVNIGVFLTASAAIFIGLGFALQQLFQDLIAGVMIIIDQSLSVGDIIEQDGKICRVEEISLRSTKAITKNDRVMIIPNHKFMNDILFNWTQNGSLVRENIDVGVAYGSDTALVKKVLLEAVQTHPKVVKENASVSFTDFAESTLRFSVFFFVTDVFEGQSIKSDLRFVIDDMFRKNNISMAFPQRDIHIIQQ
ncbi:mechanosensitive ion channel family protein [Flavobacterium silvaticum]|uniref:Mechanosensitive ion channel n=1 Tax=Flavobacterium silvaticum TaxID=1852020 RepID=A0A972JGR9_9FLAO|nr:mechanosensitive ion channel domain-containing protein [Flavobacterium silvaticum]NMH29324.1 mechanosensitive ion channel [Flavobacterium silvaticum]